MFSRAVCTRIKGVPSMVQFPFVHSPFLKTPSRFFSKSRAKKERCSTCQNPSCSPGPHCSLGWSTTPANKSGYTGYPVGDTQSFVQASSQLLMNTYARPNIVFKNGSGVYLYDTNGKKYLDFMAGIAVNALGHNDLHWVKAITTQAHLLVHSSNLYHTEPAAQLAYSLICNSQFDRAFFCNSGTEANEGALKMARKYARDHSKTELNEKTEIVAFTHGFSGRTMGSLSCTHKSNYRAPFMPLIPGVKFAPYNDLEATSQLITDKTCAVIVEPVQGEGGVTPATVPFLRGIRELCNKHNVIMIADEVQCGIGRTGNLWAHEVYGIKPDIMTLAKPLANGLPIGAILVTENISKVINPGDHGTTFGGNPFVCSVAKHVFERISNASFLKSVQEKGEHLMDRLKLIKSNHIVEVRGTGLLVGVELDVPVKDLISEALDRGVLFINAGEKVIRLCPPLIITNQEIDDAMLVLKQLIEKL